MELVEKVDSYTIKLSKDELEVITAPLGVLSYHDFKIKFKTIFNKQPNITEKQFHQLYNFLRNLSN